MKSVLSIARIGFVVLNCGQKEISPPFAAPDPMEITDTPSAAQISPDGIPVTAMADHPDHSATIR